jgi:hypothetical protein
MWALTTTLKTPQVARGLLVLVRLQSTGYYFFYSSHGDHLVLVLLKKPLSFVNEKSLDLVNNKASLISTLVELEGFSFSQKGEARSL